MQTSTLIGIGRQAAYKYWLPTGVQLSGNENALSTQTVNKLLEQKLFSYDLVWWRDQ